MESRFLNLKGLMRRFFSVLSVFALAACLSESTTGPRDPSDQDSDHSLPYEAHKAILFSPGLWADVYVPTEGSGPFPAVVLIHGGGWSGGDRGDFLPEAVHLASNGFVAAAIDYRLAPAHPFPAALQDAKAAVRWLRANADSYTIEPAQIGVVGSSSGGHLAAMVGTTAGVAEFEGEGNPAFSSEVQAVAAISSHLDLPGLWRSGTGLGILAIERFLGSGYRQDPALWAIASPITYVSPGSASFLLLHGTEDTRVPLAQAEAMREALVAEGAHVEVFFASGANHGFFFSSIWNLPSMEVITDFFTRMLNQSG